MLKDLNFNVSISPEMAAMVSIGAQANGNIVGEDATSFSKMYAGTRDRITSRKLDIFSLRGGGQGGDKIMDTIFAQLPDIEKYLKLIYKDSNFTDNELKDEELSETKENVKSAFDNIIVLKTSPFL